MEIIREIKLYENHFSDFYREQTQDVKEKIDEVLYFIRVIQRLSNRFLKHIEGVKGLYEIRISLGTNIWRVFCFFEANRIVVVLNGYLKKEMRTSPREIERAIKLMKKYYEEKKMKSQS